MPIDHDTLDRTVAVAAKRLLSEGSLQEAAYGHWTGELSSSALSTATATCALELLRSAEIDTGIRCDSNAPVGSVDLKDLVQRGLGWIASHQNTDGGWGDTIDSPSNISTTALCWAALGVNSQCTESYPSAVRQAEGWLRREAGDLTPQSLADAIAAAYGKDRTFSAPILTMCALAGRFGTGSTAWDCISSLPFELAACPHKWLHRLGLPVVSYALPALIAIGQARHLHRPTRNPVTRCLRNVTRARTLKILHAIQPSSGGFLEAAPLTSFVLMSLVSIGQTGHPVVKQAATFLASTVREDGTWPIDTNLATWVSTLAVNALAAGGRLNTYLRKDQRGRLRAWLLAQQYREEHPYTHAVPGGWAWTDLSGGVPDADDTAGALLALWHLAFKSESNELIDEDVQRAAAAGIRWLLDLQNTDGGIPTFCRGWGKLPFDRSSPDLTAHTLQAWHRWLGHVSDNLPEQIRRASRKAVHYLIRVQRKDGSWVPLWFGNQGSPNHENPLYGTTRVLRAGEVISVDDALGHAWARAQQRGTTWLLSAQNQDGGWGGAPSVSSSVEETALAVEALCGAMQTGARNVTDSVERGCTWLTERSTSATQLKPAPIGLYFASLWYSERLYPLIFTVAALERAQCLDTQYKDPTHSARLSTFASCPNGHNRCTATTTRAPHTD